MAAPVRNPETAAPSPKRRAWKERALAALTAVSLLLSAEAALAQTKKKKKKPASEPAAATAKSEKQPEKTAKDAASTQPASTQPALTQPPAPRRPRAALSRIVDAIARDLEKAPQGALVVASPLVSDTPAPKGAALAVSLAAQLAGRRGKGAWARGEPASLPLARAAARNEPGLIYLAVEIAAGQLRVTADVYPVPKTVWSRVREPEPGPIDHTFASAPIDAEVRGFLAPIPLVTVSVERAKNFESDVVALACGDVNSDGALEIVSVSRRRVSTVRIRGGKVSPIASRSWPELSPVHPSPLREPIGFATLAERGTTTQGELTEGTFVDVALTDRARSVRLDGKLQLVAGFPGVAMPDGEGTMCVRNWGLLMTGAVGPCAPSDPAPINSSVGGQYDAAASAELISPLGDQFAVWAGRERGVVEIRDSAGAKVFAESGGAQLAVGDLDQDGDPELISSLDVLNPLEDAIVVRTWPRSAAAGSKEAKLRERFRIPAAAGVRALAVCPPDGPGRAPFVVATADEIWVVR
jgi:hypothetical protein